MELYEYLLERFRLKPITKNPGAEWLQEMVPVFLLYSLTVQTVLATVFVLATWATNPRALGPWPWILFFYRRLQQRVDFLTPELKNYLLFIIFLPLIPVLYLCRIFFDGLLFWGFVISILFLVVPASFKFILLIMVALLLIPIHPLQYLIKRPSIQRVSALIRSSFKILTTIPAVTMMAPLWFFYISQKYYRIFQGCIATSILFSIPAIILSSVWWIYGHLSRHFRMVKCLSAPFSRNCVKMTCFFLLGFLSGHLSITRFEYKLVGVLTYDLSTSWIWNTLASPFKAFLYLLHYIAVAIFFPTWLNFAAKSDFTSKVPRQVNLVTSDLPVADNISDGIFWTDQRLFISAVFGIVCFIFWQLNDTWVLFR